MNYPPVVTLIVLAVALVLALLLISFGFRNRTPASSAPSDASHRGDSHAGYRGDPHAAPSDAAIIDWSRRFGVEAASQRFSLPVKAVKRLRVVSGDEQRTCGSCEHFDLAKGQLAIQNHSIMAQVTRALPPSTLSKNPLSTQSWNEFGACLKRPGMIFGSTDWCGKEVHSKIEQAGDLWS